MSKFHFEFLGIFNKTTILIFSVLLLLLALPVIPVEVNAECSEEHVTGVFVVGGIYPGDNLELWYTSIFPVGEITNPSIEEQAAAIDVSYPCNFRHVETTGNFNRFYATPGDFGGVALVDNRTGQVVFLGEIIMMGTGRVLYPTGAQFNYPWEILPDYIAAPPAEWGLMRVGNRPNFKDWSAQRPIIHPRVELALKYLRQSNALQSFSECGEYSAVGYCYYPVAGGAHIEEAMGVIVISGHCGAPFNGNVPISRESWGSVKALYR